MIAELKDRWKAESPTFWKKVKNFWYTIVGISLIVIGMSSDEINIIQTIMPPEWSKYVIKVSHYAAAIGTIAALQTKFTRKDAPLIDRKYVQ